MEAKCLVALVLSIVRGETSVAEAAHKHGLTVTEIEDWQECFALGAAPCESGRKTNLLGRHLKTGHSSTGQNRPTRSGASRRVCDYRIEFSGGKPRWVVRVGAAGKCACVCA